MSNHQQPRPANFIELPPVPAALPQPTSTVVHADRIVLDQGVFVRIVTFSPAGVHFAFVSPDVAKNVAQLLIAAASGIVLS